MQARKAADQAGLTEGLSAALQPVPPAGPVSPGASVCGRCGCSASPAAARSACNTTAPPTADLLVEIYDSPP